MFHQLAPLSGPMVIAKVPSQGKGSAKSQKSKDHAKKDHYLFEQRGEPNELKTSVGVHSGQATSSEQAVYADGCLETAASGHALQVSAKHQRGESSARGEVGMTTADNFHSTTVSGELTVDVGDFENGALCSVVQIRKSRDDFQPMEILDFVNQLASSSVNVEHGDFVKNKATALAYRKVMYVEYDETYAQAFGHEPKRPSHKQQDVNQPPKLATPAPLSGPMVIAKVPCQGKGSAKSQKSKDHAKKDHYLFEQRGEPNELKTSVGVHSGQATSSEQAVYAEGCLETAASGHALQVSAKHQSNPRQEAGEAGGMTTADNFHSTTVSGELTVDVGDFENGAPCSVVQIRKSRDDFQPMEILDFVNQLASSSVNVEHGDFVKNKATALAYRKVMYVEYDETYAQAFGHEPERPSHKQQDVNQPPKLATPAPLSGPMVIGKVPCQGKGSAKSQKSKDHAKKDHYLFEQRGEPNELKTSVGVHSGQATSSEQAVYAEGCLETAASGHALQVSAKHQSNPRQEAGEAGSMTTADNFHSTTVSGELTVDVGDFENGAPCSVVQIRKSRDDFQPMEILDFVNQLALSSVNVEHGDFVKNKATALAYRKVMYVEYDETYAQAFGHEPERPSRMQQDVDQPPKTRASLNTRAWIIRSSPESSELVSDPQFVEDHLHNLDEFRDCLVLYAPDTGYTIRYLALNGLMEIGTVDIPENFCNMMCQFVADVDGLVCMIFNGDNASILNPILQEWTVLTKIPQLPLEDTLTNICYAFGKDIDGQYKIVRFRERLQSRKNKAREIAVFSFSTSSWSVRCQRFTNNIKHMCHGVCVVGVIYLLCTSASDSGEDHDKSVISAINFSDLTGTQLDLPGLCSEEQPLCISLFPLHDNLGLVQIVKEPGRSWNRIWCLQQPADASSWEIMFKLRFNDWGSLKRYLPVRNELVMVEDQVDGSLLVYLIDSNNERKLEKRLKVDLNEVDGVYTCLASLVSVS